MWGKAVNFLKFMVCLIPLITGEDSLQSALNAVNRRQRDLSDYRKYEEYNNADDFSRYGYPVDEDNLAFLTPENYNQVTNNQEGKAEERNEDLERAILDYLEKRVDDNSNDRISSSFRERVEKDKARQKEKMAEVFLNKLYNDQENDSEEYFQQLQRLYEKYHKDYSANKNPYYSNLGWENAGMQKRSRFFQPDGPSDSLYLLNYAPRDESFGRVEEDESNPEPEFNWNKYSRQRKSTITYLKKRFPVAKRSSNYYSAQSESTHQHKRSPKKDVAKTDPKVVKELSSIFSPKNETEKKSKTKKPTPTTPKPKKFTTKSKEQVPINISYEKPIDVKKKSIDWSDYFGLDRRKKSNDVDNEWFIEKYRNAIQIDSKRSESLFGDPHDIKNDNKSEETKIKEMDAKLKNIEESIVDDALKFTGAHEDSIDSKEIQEVKDRIISRLAAAYSLEKMRHALADYKQSLEREKDKNFLKSDSKDIKSEEKRVSVPRKQAVDEEREAIEADNNIKCTEGEDCDEQTYKPPSEYLDESFWDKGKCPKIERTCKAVSSQVENYGRVFEIACNIHQMCLLCENNSWYYPTRHCNVLFISKADELCDGDSECQRVARRSIKYLLHVNRSLGAEPFTICDLDCPDTR